MKILTIAILSLSVFQSCATVKSQFAQEQNGSEVVREYEDCLNEMDSAAEFAVCAQILTGAL